MAIIEKGNAVKSGNGIVSHKMIIETQFGNFSVSLFDNNETHQAFATAFGDGSNIADTISAITTNIKIVKAEDKVVNNDLLQSLLSLKAAPTTP